MSINNFDRYCEKCDKWLDNKGTDYTIIEKPYTDGDQTSTTIQCKSCRNTKESKIVNSFPMCGYCGKFTGGKKGDKPNYLKRRVIKHKISQGKDYGYEKVIVNHECFSECFKCNQKKGLENFIKDGELRYLSSVSYDINAYGKKYCQECWDEWERKQKEKDKPQKKDPAKERESKINQLKSFLVVLETIPNRTTEQETQLANCKQELLLLERERERAKMVELPIF